VFALGSQDKSNPGNLFTYGTSFLISRKHRLLATTAHGADWSVNGNQIYAISNKTSYRYKVDKTWYHPRIKRQLDICLYVNSTDINDGEVAPATFDVAILHLAPGGPELPAECELATDEELRRLDHELVASLGFPLESDVKSLAASDKPMATRAIGGITESVKYTDNCIIDSTAPREYRYWIRSTAYLGVGGSGGPLYLKNGHVIGMLYYEIFKSAEHGRLIESIRKDAICDLMAFYSLGEYHLQSPNSQSIRSTTGQQMNNQQLRRVRQAVRLVHEADGYCQGRNYSLAFECCTRAIELIPDYAWAYLRRAYICLNHCGFTWKSLSLERKRELASQAIEDLRNYDKFLVDGQMTLPSLDLYVKTCIIHCYSHVFFGIAYSNRKEIEYNVKIIGLLFEDMLHAASDGQKAELLSLRAYSREILGDYDDALMDYNESVMRDPAAARWLSDRAAYWNRRMQSNRANIDIHKANRLQRRARIPSNGHRCPLTDRRRTNHGLDSRWRDPE